MIVELVIYRYIQSNIIFELHIHLFLIILIIFLFRILLTFQRCYELIKKTSKLQENLVLEHYLGYEQSSPIYNSDISCLLNYDICDDGKLVGQGAFGTVFVVKHKISSLKFACKRILTLNMNFRKLCK